MDTQAIPTPVFEINVQTDRVKQGIQNVRRVSEELKKAREMHKDALQGDAEYHKAEEELAEKRRALNAVKKKIEATPAVYALKEKIKSLVEEKKEEQLSLSDWLEDYKRVTHQGSIEFDGDVLTIESNYKLKKRV